jgi:hypothetical protein
MHKEETTNPTNQNDGKLLGDSQNSQRGKRKDIGTCIQISLIFQYFISFTILVTYFLRYL